MSDLTGKLTCKVVSDVAAPHIDHALKNVLQIENGEEVYLCRCGITHRGDYAIYDWGHHNCLHDYDLKEIAEDYVICPGCGETWSIERDNSTLDLAAQASSLEGDQ